MKHSLLNITKDTNCNQISLQSEASPRWFHLQIQGKTRYIGIITKAWSRLHISFALVARTETIR